MKRGSSWGLEVPLSKTTHCQTASDTLAVACGEVVGGHNRPSVPRHNPHFRNEEGTRGHRPQGDGSQCTYDEND